MQNGGRPLRRQWNRVPDQDIFKRWGPAIEDVIPIIGRGVGGDHLRGARAAFLVGMVALALVCAGCFGGGRGDEVELRVFRLFRGNETPDAAAKEILRALPRLDWRKYDRVSGGEAIVVLCWLSEVQMRDTEDVVCVLRATRGLDGALAEQYCSIVDKLYTADPKRFVRALSQLRAKEIRLICSFLSYSAGYSADKPRMEAATARLLAEPDLSEREKALAEQIMQSISGSAR